VPATPFGVTGQFIAIAPEAVYGTAPVAFNRVIPVRNDSWTPEIQEVGTDSFRPGRQAMVADQTIQVPVGGTGNTECLIPNSGGFLLFRDLLDYWNPALAAVTDASSLKKLTLQTNGVGPLASAVRSLSIMVGRVDQGQVRREAIYSGCVITGWTFSAAISEPVTLAIDWDWAQRTELTPSSEAAYTPPALAKKVSGPYYAWRDFQLQVGGEKLSSVTSFTFTAAKALDTALYALIADTLKDQPIRSGVPEYTASVEARMNAQTQALYANWGNDGDVGALVATLTGREDLKSSGSDPKFTSFVLTTQAAKANGQEPVATLDGIPTQSLDLQIKDPYDGSSLAVAIEIIGAQGAID